MYREAEKDLLNWKNQKNRSPLLVRGARQVGKSFLVEHFGRTHFRNTLVINFDFDTKFKNCFSTKDPYRITQELELLTGQKIEPNNTLLFLDEIQECPEAIKSLRYFKEKHAQLHVIAAGSLLEFTLNADEDISMPVGRVQSLFLKPFSFKEYLTAHERLDLLDFLQKIKMEENDSISESLHSLLLEYVREYFIIGGMPQVIDSYVREKSFLLPLKQQQDILDFYKLDFYKYPKKINTQLAAKMFAKAHLFVGKKFRFSELDPDILSRDQKPVLDALIMANVIFKVCHTNAAGIPLESGVKENFFKLLFLDIGLSAKASGIPSTSFVAGNSLFLNEGMLAEQFVGQELLAYHFKPYYWQREKIGSMAEIDYLVEYAGSFYPIEVKSGKTGRLKSLQVFKEEKKISLGIKISSDKLHWEEDRGILSVPFYLIWRLPELIDAHLARRG